MLRGLLMIASTIVFIGLGLALLQAFNWDIGAIITWAYEGVMKLINAVADFFINLPIFQQVVSS